jgi:site-specific DNA-methyltransferase (adenine-specific)
MSESRKSVSCISLPKPYYQDDAVTIYHGDCREILPGLPKVDLVLTDPPYNVGIDYGTHNDSMNGAEWDEWARAWFVHCREMSKTLLITGQARLPFYGQIEPWKWLLCWWKPAAMGRSPVGFCNWEPVALWGDGGSGGCDVVRAQIVPDESLDGHPCPKPLGWASGLLSLFPKAATILDPFMGSGTTLRAAKDLGRKAIGIEIEERYCEIAARRMQQEVIDL